MLVASTAKLSIRKIKRIPNPLTQSENAIAIQAPLFWTPMFLLQDKWMGPNRDKRLMEGWTSLEPSALEEMVWPQHPHLKDSDIKSLNVCERKQIQKHQPPLFHSKESMTANASSKKLSHLRRQSHMVNVWIWFGINFKQYYDCTWSG